MCVPTCYLHICIRMYVLVAVREAGSTETVDAVSNELTFRIDSSNVPVIAPPTFS